VIYGKTEEECRMQLAMGAWGEWGNGAMGAGKNKGTRG
jgi:hypothetical protein